jgi:hypothetical protein
MKEAVVSSLLWLCFCLLAHSVHSRSVVMGNTGLEHNPLDKRAMFKKRFHKMESQISRDTFSQRERSLGSVVHEVVIAVQQKNLDELKQMVYDRATPGHPLYQKWFNFQEIGEIVKNEEAYDRVKEWLDAYGASVTWSSPHKEYIKAVAPITTWEEMLSTQFYQFEDLTRPDKSSPEGKGRILHRALDYSIPAELKDAITVIFHTVQTPPRFRQQYHYRFPNDVATAPSSPFSEQYEPASYKSHLRFRDPVSKETQLKEAHGDGNQPLLQQIGADVTVSWINSYYKVNSNLASASLNQSVFETSDESFSQNDLKDFQTNYKLTVQTAQDIGGHEISDCTTETCGEGNLDIQYIMGMAQRTASIYWYVPVNGDPFITWITDVSADPYPPPANSISWGEIEQLAGSTTVKQWETEAMKLAGRGVTITVSSGDDGVANEYKNVCLCSGKVRKPVFSFSSFSFNFSLFVSLPNFIFFSISRLLVAILLMATILPSQPQVNGSLPWVPPWDQRRTVQKSLVPVRVVG